MSEAEYSLGRCCGATFAGIKPASMISIKKEDWPAICRIVSCFRKRGFSCICLKEEKGRKKMLFYCQASLKHILFSPPIQCFLRERGYGYASVQQALLQLKQRMQAEIFPHEVGIFLGYPLCDVQGFIKSAKKGVRLCGYWKVYANENESRAMFKRMKQCAACICRRMDQGEGLAEIFKMHLA